jgi:WhiB family redox-sensing transcriptional regulator
MDDALCAQIGGDLWFPEVGEGTKEAKDTCARCPVAAQCRAFAIAGGHRDGIWGGVTARNLWKGRAA